MSRLIRIDEVAKLNRESLGHKDNIIEIRYLDTGSLTKNKIENIQILRFGDDLIPSRAKRKVNKNTILYSTVRPNQEHFGFLECPPENLIVSTGFTTIDVVDKNVDPKYLYYLITQSHITKYLHTVGENSVSSYPSINPSDLGQLKFKIPERKVDQEIISAVLTNLDKKIELNNRINAELEAMAKTLYDYWFVQFDFPDDSPQGQGNPYKSSGGKMVYNPTLKREIPEGWEVAPLSSITRVSNESINPADYPEKLFKHFSIPVFDATNTFGVERGDTIGSNKFTVEDTDLLVSKLNPWFNRVVYAMAEPEQICSTEFVVWRCPNASIKNFMYMIATSPQFIAHCTQSATGTSNSHKRVNPNVMMRFYQPFNLKVAEKLGQHLEPILKQLIVNQRENTKLASLRDWLLPMLMNGQVTVK